MVELNPNMLFIKAQIIQYNKKNVRFLMRLQTSVILSFLQVRNTHPSSFAGLKLVETPNLSARLVYFHHCPK